MEEKTSLMQWMVGLGVADILLLITVLAIAAALHPKRPIADQAYKVLRLLLVVVTGSLVTALVKLYLAGIL